MQLYQGDCLELMKEIPNGSVDMVLCDPPYGTTHNSWDVRIPFAPLWEQYKRIVKQNGAICLFAQMPFAAELVMSNRKMFRYEWVLRKANPVGFLNANRMPLRAHETVQVFYKKLPAYHPQFSSGKPYVRKPNVSTSSYGSYGANVRVNHDGSRYPCDVIDWHLYIHGEDRGLHPTQKPVSICEYLIQTYTEKGETVLDNCMGSGSTGVACVNTGREFIGIELDENYFNVARERIGAAEKVL